MALQEVKDLWADYDRKLDRSIRLNTRLLRQSALDRADSSLRWLSRAILVEVLFNLAVVIALGVFIGSHLTELRFLVPAAVLDLAALLLIATGVRQLVALAAIDYGQPVVAIQKQLAELRIQRIRTSKWTLLTSPLLWTPFMIVALEALLGFDVYLLGAPYLLANLLVGGAVIPLVLWIANRHAGRLQGSPLMRSILDDLAGRNLVKATAFLDSLDRFEREEAAA